MSLSLRPPSHSWETVSVPDLPQCAVWSWVRPSNSPYDVIIRIPPEVTQRLGAYLTPRRLLAAAGGQAGDIESWFVGGMLFPSGGGNVPALDQVLPPSPDAQVIFRLRAQAYPQVMPQVGMPAMPPSVSFAGAGAVGGSGASGGESDRIFQSIEGEWQAIEILETQLSSVRKQLGTQQGKLQSLNRDLSADERVGADTVDKKDWQDARRWLRDCAAQVSRYIREHDIGVTSAAGKRTQLEQFYKEIVAPRKASPNLAAIQNEFEVYRKTSQVLLVAMQNTSSAASRDGEQRAQQILTRIAAKSRSRTKR